MSTADGDLLDLLDALADAADAGVAQVVVRSGEFLREASAEIRKLRSMLRMFVDGEECCVIGEECQAHGWFLTAEGECPMRLVIDAVGCCD